MIEKNKFNIVLKQINDINCLDISGYLDAHTAPELEKGIKDIIDSGSNRILVNFKELEYISSAGLGVFMEFVEEIRESGGDIKMSEMSDKVFSVFELLGFTLLFDIEDIDSTAIEKFEKGEMKSYE